MFLNSPSSFPCFRARAFKSWVQGESKRMHAGAGDQACDYTIMSRVVFLPNTSRKISMQEKSVLLNYSLASKDNITLAEDFCHRKDGMNFLLSFFCVGISGFTFPFGCGVCLTLGFGNMTERRNSERHRWHIPHPFIRVSDCLFWTPDWLWQPYIGDISYEREFANEMLMSSIFYTSCFFLLQTSSFEHFSK